MRILIAIVLSTACLLAFVACGDDDGGGETTAPTSSAAPSSSAGPSESPSGSTTPTAKPTATPIPFMGSQLPVERPAPSAPPIALLTDVQTTAAVNYDRITFTFEDNLPGYRVEYVEPPILADGSGNEVEIAGEAFLQIRFTTAQAHDDEGNALLDETELTPGFDSIIEVEETGDFEGYVTWVIGLPEALDFRVRDVSSPMTVSVDIAHP